MNTQNDMVSKLGTSEPLLEGLDKAIFHQAFFRRGHKPDTSGIVKNLLVILRGLPGSPSAEAARTLTNSAMSNGVKSVAVVSAEDYFVDDAGNYEFNPLKSKEYYGRAYRRAIQYFLSDTELVIVNNYNAQKRHYRHYVQTAISLGYDVSEILVGKINLTNEEFQQYHENTGGRIPESVIRSYAKQFEVS